ncbi:polysaccharide deacetylase family protein [Blastococcus sp. SYSU DS0616]
MSHRLLVLGYHNIEPTWAFSGTSPEAGRRGFERQVRFLRRWANVVPLRPALDDLAAGRSLPPRAVALTFDDGYLDNVTVAAPVLRSAGLPASFFLVPGFLSGVRSAWWEQLGWAFVHATARSLSWAGQEYDTSRPAARESTLAAVSDGLKLVDSDAREEAVAEIRGRLAPDGPELGRMFMDWDEAGELLRLGHEIESHTCGHPILSREAPAAQSRELGDSRQQLASYFDRPVDVLAFPNGRAQDYTDDTLRIAREAGYAYALTTQTAVAGSGTSPYEVPRVLVDAETDLREVLRKGARVGARLARRVLSRSSGA